MADVRMEEIYRENIKLKEDNAKLKLLKDRTEQHPSSTLGKEEQVTDDEEAKDVIEGQPCAKIFSTKKVRKSLMKYLLIIIAVACVITVYVATERQHESSMKSLVSAVSSEKTVRSGGLLPLVAGNVGSTFQDTLQKMYLNIGMRQDYQLQECQGSELKQSFPDVDYALLGYNILKGFPLATGHDPGFTYPIFQHDYSSGGMTADCRYSVPQGLVIIPDVSCVTSFSSTTVQTKYEYSKSLSVSASASAGGWGISFSASAGYKQSSSEISTGESVYILSTAHCNYYFSKLITEDAPQFDKVFLKWVYKLNETGDSPDLYFEFFETYGTHFPTEVTFGARFTYEHKMASSKYEREKKSGVNVAVQASYSGLFSAGGGFSLDSDQKESASAFSKSVETRTITVGAAPPANGDAMTWASEVKTSPVPTAYKLSSIEFLFTGRYMSKLNIDHDRIRSKIEENKHAYCLYLRNEGKVESCESLVAGIEMGKTKLAGHFKEIEVALSSDCIEKCLDEIHCVAVSSCTTCKSYSLSYNTCYMFEEEGSDKSGGKTDTEDSIWQSNIFPEKIKSRIEFKNTGINGVARGFEKEEDKKASLGKCHDLCIRDAHCVAYTHCDCPDKIVKCNMYGKERISGLIEESGTRTFFISSRQNIVTTTTTTTTTSSKTTQPPPPPKTTTKTAAPTNITN